MGTGAPLGVWRQNAVDVRRGHRLDEGHAATIPSARVDPGPLAVPGVKVPAWVEAVGRALLGMGFVELTVVVANGASSEAHAGGRWPGGRLWRAYRTLDLRLQRLVCRRSADPSAVVDLDGLGCALVDKPPDELDLLIGAHDPSALRALAARVDAPVWWLDHDGHERWPAAAAGYAEVLSGCPVTRCRLMAVAPGEWEPAVLRTALFATHPLFGAENRVQLLWKSIPLLVQKVSELRDRGEVTCEVREGREGVGVREKPWGGRSGLVCALARQHGVQVRSRCADCCGAASGTWPWGSGRRYPMTL